MGPHSRGPYSRGPASNTLKPFWLENPLSESAFARVPSFVGPPLFVGALCCCTSCTCLNPALAHRANLVF
jgi:hypothetical protein